jgi:hypothetical protein
VPVSEPSSFLRTIWESILAFPGWFKQGLLRSIQEKRLAFTSQDFLLPTGCSFDDITYGEGAFGCFSFKSPCLGVLIPELIELFYFNPTLEHEQALQAFNDAENRMRTLQDEQRNLDDLMKYDYGPQGEFAKLKGECVSIDTQEYTDYTPCI